MEIILLALRLALAGIFLVSGIAKLVDRDGSRESVRAFGVPVRLSGPFAILLPVAELAVAAALLFSATAIWGGVAGLALFVVFTAAIGYQLSQGRTPDCHCFGALSSGAISRRTVARNGGFALIAAAFVGLGWGDPGPGVFAWTSDLSATEGALLAVVILLAAAVAGGAWMIVQLMGQNGRILERLDALESRTSDLAVPTPAPRPETLNAGKGLPVGSIAPVVELPTLDGPPVSTSTFASTGLPYVLIFTSPDCLACESLMPEIAAWQNDYAHVVTTAVIGRGDPEPYRLKSAKYDIPRILMQEGGEVSRQFQVNAFPGAVMVDTSGEIGSGPAQGAVAVRALFRSIIGDQPALSQWAAAPPPTAVRAAPVSPPVGTVLPDLVLKDLERNRVSLSDYARRAESTLVLLWNPTCSFCQRLAPLVQRWERQAQGPDSQLVVVSRGGSAANRDLGLGGPVLLDDDSVAMTAFGARGTPAAIVLDRDGRVTTSLMAGLAPIAAWLQHPVEQPVAMERADSAE